ncbi:MAG: Gfo/Idh/MocA family protein, partial [Pyrinomonadaceae bacterium]
MKKKTIRVAIIGLGAAFRNIHFPAYKMLAENVEIVAGCDTNEEARKWMRAQIKTAEIFDDPGKMLAATAPDIVSICTPPALHVEQTLLVLEHHAHVFCEKPLAEDLTGAARIIQSAERKNKFVVVNSQFPFMNIHRAAKQMIDSAEFGRLLFLQVWQIFHPSHNTESGWRGTLKRRLCYEFGIHVFELARYFFNAEPVSIMAQMPQPQAENQCDTLNLITLDFGGGRAASIILNRISHAPERYLDMRLDGEKASIQTSIGGQVKIEAGIHTRSKRPFFGLDITKGGSAVLQNGNTSRILAKDGINPFASSTAKHFGNFVESIQNNTEPEGIVQ